MLADDLYGLLLLFLLATAFLLGFVWFILELILPFALAAGILVPRPGLFAILLGLSVFLVIGASGWLSSPDLAKDFGDGEPFRLVIWVFWSVGFLFKTGNFSDHPCGY